jgi:hypothetical protein
VGRAGQPGASLNGNSVQFKSPPIELLGRTMLPLAETVALFGIPLNRGETAVSVGRLRFAPTLESATLDGRPTPSEGNLIKRGDDVYVSAKLLADAIGARLSLGSQHEFYFSLVRSPEANPLAPQARFSTDKDVYAIGEPVKIEEYSFDPQGGTVYLHWTNMRPAYFRAGTETITLSAENSEGHSNKISRTITITNRVENTPLEFALKYSEIGDFLNDDTALRPTLSRNGTDSVNRPLLVSDSPEEVDCPGALFRTTVSGPARVLAYHLNSGNASEELCVAVKNVDEAACEFRTVRIGDTAPTSIEGVLGQVTLLSFLTDHKDSSIHLEPGESALLYVSTSLRPKTGVSLLADFSTDRRCEVTVAMTLSDNLLSPEEITKLEPLAIDGRHVRGVFPSAVRRFTLDLGTTLPAKAIIGDPTDDPPEIGEDPFTKAKVTLDGNYGVTYEITLRNANGVVGAIAPRGGVYKGAVVVDEIETKKRSLVRLPRSGVLVSADQPMIFFRSGSPTVRLRFIPASGSQLPVHLAFYRP